MRISDWSSDVCSSDLRGENGVEVGRAQIELQSFHHSHTAVDLDAAVADVAGILNRIANAVVAAILIVRHVHLIQRGVERHAAVKPLRFRSEEHTSELQSLMRISYAVFCLKKKINQTHHLKLTTRLRTSDLTR